MQIEQLEYIISIAKNHSISKAAQEIHISQSGMSQAVFKLEEELGIKIFIRSNIGVIPTAEGEQLIQKASEVIMKVKEFREMANEYKKQDKKELTVGLVTGLHLPFLPNIIAKTREQFPNTAIYIIEKSSIELVIDVERKEIDIAILSIYENTLKYEKTIDFKKINEIKMFVFVDKNSSLASYKTLTPKNLLDQTFVMYNGELMNWFFTKFNNRFGEYKVLFTSKNSETLREAVRKGLAITIETGAELMNNPYIKSGEIIPIQLAETIPEKIFRGLAKQKNRELSIIEKTFIGLLEYEMHNMLQDK